MHFGYAQYKQKGLSPILIVLIIAALAGAFYLGKTQSKPIPPTPQKATQPSPTPSPVDETANWKTYTNKKYGYSIKYPQGILVLERSGSADFYLPGEYSEVMGKINTPDGFLRHLAIYYRTSPDIMNRPIQSQDIIINNAKAFKMADAPLDYFVKPVDKEVPLLRIVYIQAGVLSSEEDKDKVINLFQQMVPTFKFTN